jgi:hypothetical protein
MREEAVSTETREVLVNARKLIEDSARWTKHESAREADGKPTWSTSSSACQWCAYGALLRAESGRRSDAERALERGIRALGSRARTVWGFNDYYKTDHARVLAAFDKAIAAVDEGEQS